LTTSSEGGNSSSIINSSSDNGPEEKQSYVIELFIEKEECMQAKFFDNAIVSHPQEAVNFMGNILESR